jgi:hypothetical protein
MTDAQAQMLIDTLSAEVPGITGVHMNTGDAVLLSMQSEVLVELVARITGDDPDALLALIALS